jgi:FHA domain-containing protein
MKVLAGKGVEDILPSGSSKANRNATAIFNNSSAADPFGDLVRPALGKALLKNAPTSEQEINAANGRNTFSTGLIPPDFDPFAETPSSARAPLSVLGEPAQPNANAKQGSTASPGDISGALGSGPSIPSQSIDELFRLSPGGNTDPLLPGSPLGPRPDHTGATAVDPLEVLGTEHRAKPSAEPAQRDDVPELHGSFRPPHAKPEREKTSKPGVEHQEGHEDEPSPYGMVLSWESEDAQKDTDEVKSVIIPSPVQDRRKEERRQAIKSEVITAAQSLPVEADRPQRGPDAGVSYTESPASSPASTMATAAVKGPGPRATAVDRDQLLKAFLDGAGISTLSSGGELTPQFMHLVGELLRESTQGTLDLLLARTLTKREVRAELTMISPRENNPLKFSPDVEVALNHLLGPAARGFMSPVQAMKDAYDDLRSHELGFMAGTRAALTGILERFDPERLEQRLKDKSVIDALVPINRKARLWNLFAEHYKEISREAEEDFQALFGKEFLRAYKAQIANLEKEGEK